MVIVLTGSGLRLLDTAAKSGSLEGLMILGSGLGADTGRGLLDIALEDAVLISLTILGLGSGSQSDYGSLGKEPCETVAWSLQKLLDAVCEERNLNGAFKQTRQVTHIAPLCLVPTLTSQHIIYLKPSTN